MPTGKMLMAAGAFVFVVGLLFTVGARLGLGRLPGDITARRGNTSFYFPMITSILLSIVLSIVLTIVLNLVLRSRR